MSSKNLCVPFIRHVATRRYAQAAPAIKEVSIQHGTVNQTSVISVDNGSPVTRVTVAFRAGSRYEPQTELGISHVLRSAAGLSTGKASSFMISRKLAQIGATFNASGDRELIYYTLEATQDHLEVALEYLTNIISCQEFRPWELSDNVPRLKYELAALTPQVRAVDLLHRAAFRRGLGNSIFVSPKRVATIGSESLQHFATSTLTPARCAVVVVGNNQDKASIVAQALQLSTSSSASDQKSAYFGGELRKEMGGALSHVALALQGAAAGSKESLALAIAAKAFGSGPVTKWGTDNSPLAKTIGNIGPFAAAGFNVSYSDNGLFGVILTVPKDEANTAVKAVGKFLKSPSLPSEAIKAGKCQLKLQVLSEADTGSVLCESLAAQALSAGAVKSPLELANAIDQIAESDVLQAVSSAAKRNLSMGSAGNLAFVPYIDEI
ncbi:cytochrome b-c1 complex subunit 2, mitochondrial-like [Leptidea sinapis]|uniref:cytochrome b-c1 complex subunit 2, mitochondrial-like n=1 Tax=Leptidea sinapis TaxID=189913 RepID=UPI002135A4FD|nr:cytochrome b-c1 complex subunit 2, mitochondrial-like [Leptidea sinapis]